MNLEQKKFEEWKRRHGKLDEGFLDGNDDLETADVPSEDAASEEEKDLSFQIEYSGGHDLVNAFIASPANGSDNVQRMLIAL